MNRTKIETADYNFNPFMGCTHNCAYCYARELNNRFSYIPDFSKPQLFKNKLHEPIFEVKRPKSRNRIAKLISPINPVVFVGTMGDLFCSAIPDSWINAVLGVAFLAKHYTFMFYTKNPKRYQNFTFSNNCIIGTTIDYSKNTHRLNDLLKYDNTKVKKFVSIEPLLSSFDNIQFAGIDFVIVGAQTGRGAKPPQIDWINSIKHPTIYYKDNIQKYLQPETLKQAIL